MTKPKEDLNIIPHLEDDGGPHGFIIIPDQGERHANTADIIIDFGLDQEKLDTPIEEMLWALAIYERLTEHKGVFPEAISGKTKKASVVCTPDGLEHIKKLSGYAGYTNFAVRGKFNNSPGAEFKEYASVPTVQPTSPNPARSDEHHEPVEWDAPSFL